MGIDINIYCEARLDDDAQWWGICGEVFVGRNRTLFDRLGRARSMALFPLRGLPAGLSPEAEKHVVIHVDGDWRSDYTISRAEAEQMVAEGKTRWYDERQEKILDPDLIDHSWLTTDEYRRVLDSFEDGPAVEWAALLALLEVYERGGFPTRIVFWFDY
ncbi:hypothetical protein OF829_09595 [Sphingomonas sp. LB-2]|uniref:hypothetical protein n=1 Tax=Sphingomonas caeni TaxID=2984949 RepID=UPI00223175F4|nr:hypothetical protein [Sphingomonas caeni]MCW3847496.1 hypothetical protein [Sphingomonas caeni]